MQRLPGVDAISIRNLPELLEPLHRDRATGAASLFRCDQPDGHADGPRRSLT